MKLKLLVSMSGDNYAHEVGDIIDTVNFASKPTEACPKPLTPDEIGRLWIEVGHAAEPQSTEVLSADIAVVEAKLADVQSEATAARELAEEASTENVALKAQVVELIEATGDGADLSKRNAELSGRLAAAEKLVAEREASLANVRTTVAAELREQIERDVRASLQNETADPALDAAIAALDASSTSLSNAITAS